MEALAHQAAYIDPDGDLVVAAQRDQAQFVVLYDRYFPRVYRYVLLRVNHTQQAEDITSQVFLSALARLKGFHPSGSFAAWLFRIAHNAVQDTFRARTTVPDAATALAALADHEPGPESQAQTRDAARAVRAIVGTLRPEQQHLLALRFGAGLSAVEIGVLLDKRSEAVRMSLHRAIKELRQRYSHDD